MEQDFHKSQEKPTLNQADYLLTNLNKLREEEILTDITIIVQYKKFKAHKVVLAASSDYFKAMFSDDMVESRNNHVTLHGIPSYMFQSFLMYFYTSTIYIDHHNVNEILAAAMYLQVVPVVNECVAFLTFHLDEYICLDVLNIAEDYSLVDMQETVYTYLCQNFRQVANLSNWCQYKGSHLSKALSMDLAINVPEFEILYFVLKWIFSSSGIEFSEKMKYIDSILSHIRFHHITYPDLEWVQGKFFTLINNSKPHPLHVKLMNRINHKTDISIVEHRFFNTRGTEPSILRIGGFSEDGLTNGIWYSPQTTKEWFKLTTIPHYDQCNYGVVVLRNQLYIIGGCFNQTYLQEVIHPYGFKFDPWTRRWSRIPTMLTDRCRFSLNACDGKLYAVGGATDADDVTECTSACERYNPQMRKWEYFESLPYPRTQHAGTSIEVNGEEKLYVSGGMCRDSIESTMFCYSPIGGSWTACADMLTPRTDHSMIAYKNKLYVCGGWYEVFEEGVCRKVMASCVDAYDCLENSWETVSWVPETRNHTGVVADGAKIYIIGGFLRNSNFHTDTTPVQTYDIEKNVWSSNEKMPQQCWEHACVMMHVPKNLKSIVCDKKLREHLVEV